LLHNSQDAESWVFSEGYWWDLGEPSAASLIAERFPEGMYLRRLCATTPQFLISAKTTQQASCLHAEPPTAYTSSLLLYYSLA